jgi:hypothetical protein
MDKIFLQPSECPDISFDSDICERRGRRLRPSEFVLDEVLFESAAELDIAITARSRDKTVAPFDQVTELNCRVVDQ